MFSGVIELTLNAIFEGGWVFTVSAWDWMIRFGNWWCFYTGRDPEESSRQPWVVDKLQSDPHVRGPETRAHSKLSRSFMTSAGSREMPCVNPTSLAILKLDYMRTSYISYWVYIYHPCLLKKYFSLSPGEMWKFNPYKI